MWRSHALAAALFVALAVALTWPLAANLGSAVAWPGDPFINTWILDWDWWATFHQPLSLFQANTFYPAKLPLAYSENLYGIAVVLFPFRAAGLGPVAAYNVAMLLGYAFSGFGAYALGRYVTGGWWAGVAAGIFYAFVPFRITHASHVQHVWAGWLPLLIVALLHYAKRPTWIRAALFGAAFLMNGLSNVHWLLFGSVAIFAAFLIVRPRPLPIATCTLGAALLLAPFLIPYAKVAREYDMRRTWQETKRFSAEPRDWLVAAETMRWYGKLKDADVDPERWLFPGALAILFSAIGVTKKPRGIALAWILLGVAGALGTHLFFHRFLFAYVPGFQAIRVPARWANIAYAGMAMLIANGVKRFAPLAAAALVVELCAAPLLWYLVVPGTPPVYREIHGPTLELPIGQGLDYAYMLHATAHHQPIVNGVSGFTPPETLRIASLVNSDLLIGELNRIGVGTIVVHGDAADDATRQWLGRELARGHLGFVQRFDGGISGDWLFRLGGGTRRAPDLDAFLSGQPTYNHDTFGFVDFPQPGQRIADKLYVSGFALSPYGIRSITLRFANGRVCIAPFLFDDPTLRRRFPWYDATAKPRFVREFDRRPPGVAERTDLQVEIVDGRGRRVLLEDRFFIWPDRR
ncbi:MAG TPA: hypothetical protein VJZ76_05490 [Thermoanaerobaculia bacterium]|nr:hypothetical protein [Thermoanaerobaculia bacterium]